MSKNSKMIIIIVALVIILGVILYFNKCDDRLIHNTGTIENLDVSSDKVLNEYILSSRSGQANNGPANNPPLRTSGQLNRSNQSVQLNRSGQSVPSNLTQSALAQSALGQSALAQSALAQSIPTQSVLAQPNIRRSANPQFAADAQYIMTSQPLVNPPILQTRQSIVDDELYNKYVQKYINNRYDGDDDEIDDEIYDDNNRDDADDDDEDDDDFESEYAGPLALDPTVSNYGNFGNYGKKKRLNLSKMEKPYANNGNYDSDDVDADSHDAQGVRDPRHFTYKKNKYTRRTPEDIEDLFDINQVLPQEFEDWFDVVPSQMTKKIKGTHYIHPKIHMGINTVGSSNKNGSLDIRGDVANPQISVSPWNNSTIEPSISRGLCG